MKNLVIALTISFISPILYGKTHHGSAKVEVVAKSKSSWDGSMLPAYPAGQPEVTILKITIPAGTKLPVHKHGVINAGYMLKGQLTVIKEDGRKLYLSEGDSLIELVDQWHYGRNDGKEPVEILVFYAGVEGMPITIKK